MSIDLENGYQTIESKSKAAVTYIEIKQSADEKKREVRDNLEQNIQKTTTTIDNLKDQEKRFQRQTKTQLDKLLSISQFSSGAGSSSLAYIKKKFIEATIVIEPAIYNILLKETIKALGCSQQQEYTPQSIYIKVASTDLLKLLKSSPTDNWVRVAYEKIPPYPGQIPYSMNRQMWERLQSLNAPIDYYGASGQKLFTITYVNFDGSISGDFFKIDLANKTIGLNKVANFLVDYYKSIKIIDLNNLFQQLIDMICGAISFEAKLGFGELQDRNQFLLILQRILGLCFDNVREIDVSGASKIAELDNINQSFFEFTEMDLRYIDDQIWNTQNGVVEFEDCQNVKLPVNSKNILNHLLDLGDITKVDDILNLTNIVSDDERWNELTPNSVDINLSIDLSFLLNLPKAIMMAILSPKVILPLLIMSKALGQTIGYTINGLMDFMKQFSKYCINIMSKIGAIFVEELFNLISKDLQNLLASIAADLAKEKALKKYAMILKLIQLISLIVKLVDDWRKCKSVVDELLAIFNTLKTSLKQNIPTPLLAAAEILDGYSQTRALINTIEEYQKVGLPTGPMPDGSPNLMLIAQRAVINGTAQEQFENGKVQVYMKPLTVVYGSTTLPTGEIYGKYY